jgi:glycosyltransferase involved in cell wall biosynthesis
VRVAIDYTSGLHQRAGIGRYTRGIVNAIADLDRDNSYVLLCATGGQPSKEAKLDLFKLVRSHPNFSLRTVPLSPRLLTMMWHRLRLPIPVDIFTGPVDVFHWPDFLAGHQATGKRVITVHDLSFMALPQCADPKLRRFLARVVPRSIARADAVVTVSDSTRRDILQFARPASPQAVEVVYNGIETAFFSQQLIESLPVTGNDLPAQPYILFVGTIEPRKNILRLLDAYALALQSGVAQRLLLVGGLGWMYRDILDRMEDPLLKNRAVLVGRIADKYLPAIYRRADLFVYPSLYEGFGFPVLEAMACGTPVLSSNTSALAEVAGSAARLVDPLDIEAMAGAIVEMVGSVETRATMSAAGIERARHFTWRTAGTQLLNLYARLS